MSDKPTADDFATARAEASHWANPRRFNAKHPMAAAGRVLLYLLSRPQPSEPGAEALRAAKAEAWDEGFDAAIDDFAGEAADNPYRRDRSTTP